MDQYNEYGEWLTEQTQECNIFSALSNNLQRYENSYKHSEHIDTKTRPPAKKNQKGTLKTINHPDLNKENEKRNELNERHEGVKYKNWLQRIDRNGEETSSVASRKELQEKDFKIRITSRNSRSSQEQREDLMPLKLKEFKFEKRDKKRFKDRCVELYAEIKSKNRISLKQIDSINKQCKEEKIELFLKLLRR